MLDETDFRGMVVWGFHEEEKPFYTQGRAGEHELTSPLTADEANKLVNLSTVLVRDMKAELDRRKMGVRYLNGNWQLGREFNRKGGGKLFMMLPEFPPCEHLVDVWTQLIASAG